MEPLLEKAKLYIPARYWISTPIALKATAGLRLLPGDQANAILNEVSEILCFVINLNKAFCDVLLGDRKQKSHVLFQKWLENTLQYFVPLFL